MDDLWLTSMLRIVENISRHFQVCRRHRFYLIPTALVLLAIGLVKAGINRYRSCLNLAGTLLTWSQTWGDDPASQGVSQADVSRNARSLRQAAV
jgi:hypothetical protein